MKMKHQKYINKISVWLLLIFIACNCCHAGQIELLKRYRTLQKGNTNSSSEERLQLINELISDYENELNSNTSEQSSFFLISLGKLYGEVGRIDESLLFFNIVAEDESHNPDARLRAANLAVSGALHVDNINTATQIFDRYEKLIEGFKEKQIEYSLIYDKHYLVLDHKRAKFLEDYGISLAIALEKEGKHQEAEACKNEYRIKANNLLDKYMTTTLKDTKSQEHLEWLKFMNWDEAATLYKSSQLDAESASYYSSIGEDKKADLHIGETLKKLDLFFEKHPNNPKFSQANAVLLLKTKKPFFNNEKAFFEYTKQLETKVSGEGLMFLSYLYRIGGELSDEGKYISSNNFIALAKDLFEDKYPDRLTSDLLYCEMLFSLGNNYAILCDATSLDDIINSLGKCEFTSFEDTERYKNLKKSYESIISLYLEGLEEQDADIEVSIADIPVTKPIVESAKSPTLPAVEQKNELMNMMLIVVVVLTFGIVTSLMYFMTKRKKIHNT